MLHGILFVLVFFLHFLKNTVTKLLRSLLVAVYGHSLGGAAFIKPVLSASGPCFAAGYEQYYGKQKQLGEPFHCEVKIRNICPGASLPGASVHSIVIRREWRRAQPVSTASRQYLTGLFTRSEYTGQGDCGQRRRSPGRNRGRIYFRSRRLCSRPLPRDA